MPRVLVPIGIFAVSVAIFLIAWLTVPPARLPGGSSVAPSRRNPDSHGDGKSSAASEQSAQLPLKPAQARLGDGACQLKPGGPASWPIALTYDDGPHPQYTPALLRVLRLHGVRATFFLNGTWLDGDATTRARIAGIVRRARREQHDIANHGYSHQLLSTLSAADQTREIVANEIRIHELTGARMRYFRAPYGGMTPHAREVLLQYGYIEAPWTAAVPNESTRSAQSVAEELLSWLHWHAGGVVLLHDRFATAVSATAILLQAIDSANQRRSRANEPQFAWVTLEQWMSCHTRAVTKLTPAAHEAN